MADTNGMDVEDGGGGWPPVFLDKFKANNDNFYSFTSAEQKRVEELVEEKVESVIVSSRENGSLKTLTPTLHKSRHSAFLRKALASLDDHYECLDASQPWLVYWILQSMNLLEEPIPESTKLNVVNLLSACQNSTLGGYGGGPDQMPHLATTYAAVMTLCSLGTPQALESINRKSLYSFLKSMREGDGGWRMHGGGETDVRGAYCALAVATLTNIQTQTLFDKTAEWVVSCQTYEGGYGACAGTEAHGGYTFCGLAALIMLGRDALVDVSALSRWLAFKQMKYEGGFQGRTNKLVDGCYSFWQAASFPLIQEILVKRGKANVGKTRWLFDSGAAQCFVLMCCQSDEGGLVDKPGKRPDLYHTCYTLSGLSICQHLQQGKTDILGPDKNKLAATHPIYNIILPMEQKAREYFGSLPLVD